MCVYRFVCALLSLHVCLCCFRCLICLLYLPSVLWYCWLGLLTCKNRLPYNLYCVGGDVKHCTIQSLNPTALDGAHTHINFLDIQPIFRTVTSSPACCTKTPIRHYLSFLLCCVCMYMPGECFPMTVSCALFCTSGCSFYFLSIGCVLSCQFYNKIKLNWTGLSRHL